MGASVALAAALLTLPSAAFAQDGNGSGGNGGDGGDQGGAQEDAAPAPEPATTPKKIRVHAELRGNIKIGKGVTVVGSMRPFVAGQKLKLLLKHRGDVVDRDVAKVKRVGNKNQGRATFKTKRLVDAGKYSAEVIHQPTSEARAADDQSGAEKLKFPSLSSKSQGKPVAIFHNLLRKQGYGNAPGGDEYNDATARAIMAFRKVNGMPRTYNYDRSIFKQLAAGKGAFKLKYPNEGKHVEVDISKQVMVLADNGKPQYTYHVSTGAPATPSDRGHYQFYRKDAGYNSIGMYYSVYYNRGEATHGYKSVPTYNASHGCIRNPIPDSQFIYGWIDLGDDIWVYD